MKCKDVTELLAAYLDNEVTSDEREQIEAHLSACPSCREELEPLAATQTNLRHAFKLAAARASPSPRAWAAVKQRLAVEERPRVTIWGLANSKLKGGKDIVIRGLVLRQPVWKTAVIGVLAVALIAGLGLGTLLLPGQSSEALAAEIAKNDPQVRLALSGGEVEVVKVVRIVDDEGTVICEGTMGQLVIAEVDLKNEVVTEVIFMPELTEAEIEEAVNIARNDPEVQQLLDQGATIGNVSPMYSFVMRVNLETGEIEEFSGSLVRVEIELGENIWVAQVDLDEGKVVRLAEINPHRPGGRGL
ncbi:hypothetical protein ES703_23763 [subsurface metagenome]